MERSKDMKRILGEGWTVTDAEKRDMYEVARKINLNPALDQLGSIVAQVYADGLESIGMPVLMIPDIVELSKIIRDRVLAEIGSSPERFDVAFRDALARRS